MKKKDSYLQTLQIRLSPVQIRILDKMVLEGTYLNRVQAIRKLVAKQLKQQKYNLEEWL